VPRFCRHNRFVQNCPICKEPEPEPARTPRRAGIPGGSGHAGSTGVAGSGRQATAPRGGARRAPGLRVRQVARAEDDGFRSPLAPGLRGSGDAERLADELAFSAGRLAELADDPPGTYAEIASEPDAEEAAWRALLVAYLSPGDGEDPFAEIERVRTSWASGDVPVLDGVTVGPRSPHDPARGPATLAAYRAWAARAGSQAAALAGEAAWSPERRFERIFERLGLPGLSRSARIDLLTMLGRLGLYELRAATLHFHGEDPAVTAAKRVFAIADPLLLDRRAVVLAEACAVPLEALELALHNWETPRARITLGARPAAAGRGDREGVAAALGL
jgi:hypothetical protein